MDETLNLLEDLAESGKLLGHVTSSAELYQTVFKNLKGFLQHDRAAIWLKDPAHGALSIAAAVGWEEEERAKAKILPGQGVAGRALKFGETQLVQETIEGETGERGGVAMSEVAIPLKDGMEVLGVLTVKRFDEKFDDWSRLFFAVFGEQVAATISRLKLKGAIDLRARKLVSVSKAGQALTAGETLDTSLDSVLSLAESALNPDGCSIQLIDGDGELLLVIAAKGASKEKQGTRIPAGQGIGGIATQTLRPSLIPDTSKSEHRAVNADDYLSEIAVPLMFKGAILGVLHFGQKLANRFDETDLLHAMVFADQLAALVGCDRLLEELYLHDIQIRHLTRALDVVASGGESAPALDELFDLTKGILVPSCAAVLVPDEEEQNLKFEWASAYPEKASQTPIPVENSIPGEAYRTASTVLVPDVERDPRYVETHPKTRSEIATPIRAGGKIVGVLLVDSIIELDEDRAKTAEHLAVQVAMLLNR